MQGDSIIMKIPKHCSDAHVCESVCGWVLLFLVDLQLFLVEKIFGKIATLGKLLVGCEKG